MAIKELLIKTGDYWCGFTKSDPQGDKSIGIIYRRERETGKVVVLSQLDEHGVALVEVLAEKLQKSQHQTVIIPTIWSHLSARKVAGIYEQAMTKAGVKWINVDNINRQPTS